MSRLTRRVALKSKAAAVTAGQQLFTASGTFTVPAGVTSICAASIGAGAAGSLGVYGGAGGGLSYSNGLSVTPGQNLAVDILTTQSTLRDGVTPLVSASAGSGVTPGTATTGTGFPGGAGRFAALAAGAGAGGYTSAGQASATVNGNKGGAGTSLMGGGGGGAENAAPTALGGVYGGGGSSFDGAAGGAGGVRVIWGAGRAFPNTNTGDAPP